MAIVGAVEIDLVARVARLQSDLEKATGLIKGFKDKSVQHFDGMSRAAENVGRTITAMVSVAGLSMISNFAKNVATSTDELINQAKYLGISADKLSAFQHMALLAGVSSEGMTSALGKFSKGLGDAADGTGPVADKIKSLGLSIETLRSMSPDEAFLQIGEAIGKLSSSSEKAAATTAIFGKSQIGLINVFDDMRGSLASAEKEVEKFRLSLSAEDQVKVQALDDSFDRLEQSIKGAGRSLVVDFADGLKSVVDFSANAVESMRKHWTLGGPLLVAIKLAKDMMQDRGVTPENGRGAIDRGGDAPAAPAVAGLGKREWAQILKDSQENYDKLFELTGASLQKISGIQSVHFENFKSISDEAWQSILAQSAINYESEMMAIAIAQDSQVELYRNHKANMDAEHEVSLERWRMAEESHAMDMGAIWQKQQELETAALQNRLSITSNLLGSLSQLVGSQGKAGFELSKKLAYAETIVSTYAAAQYAYFHQQKLGNPVGAVVAAGAAIISGIARARAISATSFGGGGGAGAGGGGVPTSGGSSPGSGTTTQSAASAGQTGGQSQILVTVIVDGAVKLSQLADEYIIPIVQDRIANNDLVLARQGSRQHIEMQAA